MRMTFLSALSRRGATSMEFALITPILALIAMGAFDYGNAVHTSMRLERAARAGAQYGLANPSDVTGMRSAVIAAWPELTITDVPLPVQQCFCGGTEQNCSDPCGSTKIVTVTVTAQKTISPIIIQGLASRIGTAVLRTL